MPSERVIEIPWALSHLPQSGVILDIGSCDATYLQTIPQIDRALHCIDPRDCACTMPRAVTFHRQSVFGNTLPEESYDAVLLISVLEHMGLPTYGQIPVPGGDALAVAECWRLLKPGCPLIVTVPAGKSKVMSWYRQYSPAALERLFEGWRHEIHYWGYVDNHYALIELETVEAHDYRDRFDGTGGAGAVAGIIAYRS